MNPDRLTLLVLPDVLAVARLPADAALPAWAMGGALCSLTRTAEELSIVCPASAVPAEVRCERGWRCLRVAGTMPFSLVGVLAALVGPLAKAGISVFALSTFDTDYLLVQEPDLARACQALQRAGHEVRFAH
jgi:hypothetical protein